MLLTTIVFSLSSCSWGVLLIVGNSLDHDIVITYKINESEFTKKPKTYVFDQKLKNLYKNNSKKKPIEIPNDAVYDSISNTVIVTIKPHEAAFIGGYGSFESFEEEIIKSKLKVKTAKNNILTSEQLIETRTNLTRKITVLDIK